MTMSFEQFRDEVAAVPWGYVFHAAGPATDTPEHLVALAAADDAAREAAVTHLTTAIVHDGRVWPASPDALRLAAVAISANPLPPGQANLLDAALAAAESALAAADPQQPNLSLEATMWCWQTCAGEGEFAVDVAAPEFTEVMGWAATMSRPHIAALRRIVADRPPYRN